MILALLAVAGCAGSSPGRLSREPARSTAETSATASRTTTPAAVNVPHTSAAVNVPRTSASPSTGARCGQAHAAGTAVLALPGGRRALLAVPDGDNGHRRLGLVVALPGYGRTSEEMASQSRIPARAMAAGVQAVLPEGAGPDRSWNFSGTTGHDDLAFLSALVKQLVNTACADPARVVITGISDGGDMAVFAACALPGRFRAVITVAASINPRADCQPIPIVAVHGDADPVDPYRGKPGPPGYAPTPPAAAAIAAWAALDGCQTATTTRVAPRVVLTTYPCGVQLVTVNGGGHTWPGGAPVNPSLGVTTSEYDATAKILALTDS